PFGLEGVAVAVAVPNVLFCLFVIGYSCRTLDVSPGRYLLTGWLRPLAVACVPTAVWCMAAPAEPTWIGIATGIAWGLLPYAIVVAAVEAPRPATTRASRKLTP